MMQPRRDFDLAQEPVRAGAELGLGVGHSPALSARTLPTIPAEDELGLKWLGRPPWRSNCESNDCVFEDVPRRSTQCVVGAARLGKVLGKV
jgi:hypothetical protein